MTISLRAACSNVMSDNYNKKNMAVYLILMLVSGVLCTLTPNGKTIPFNAGSISALIAYIILLMIATGFVYVSIHNRLNKKPIVPDLVSDFRSIFFVALKVLAGMISIALLSFLVSFIISLVLTAILPFLSFIVFPLLFTAILLLTTGLILAFVKDLDLKAWFNFANAYTLVKENIKSILVFYLKVFISILITVVVSVPLIFLIGVILGFVFGLIIPKTTLIIVSQAIGGALGAILGSLFTFVYVDLKGQLASEVYNKGEALPQENNNQEIVQE